jgi:hypothetical protein
VTSRVVALVSASVFDAVNGIDPRFRSLHVRAGAPHHASERAAAVQAAYAILLKLHPAQDATLLTPHRNASLAALALTESAKSIAAGVAWGQTVADAIPWCAEHRRNAGRHGFLAPDAAGVAQQLAWSVRSGTAFVAWTFD